MDGVTNLPPIVNSPYYYDHALTPESMMVYLTTRLSGIDEQIQGHMQSQEQSEKLRAAVNAIKAKLNELPQSSDKGDNLEGKRAVLDEIASIIDEQIAPVDPNLAQRLTDDLSAENHILYTPKGGNGTYTTTEIENSQKYLETIASELESTAQMNMIHLQSLMSGRQTAISLATNLLASLGESSKKIVDNIR